MNITAVNVSSVVYGLGAIGPSPAGLGSIILITLLIGFGLTVLSFAMFSRFAKYLTLMGKTIVDAVIGTIVLATLYGLYWLTQLTGRAIEGVPPIYYAYILAGFIVCAIMGKISVKAVERLEGHYKKLQKENPKASKKPTTKPKVVKEAKQ